MTIKADRALKSGQREEKRPRARLQ